MGLQHQKKREFLDVLVALRQIIRATDVHSKQVMKICGLTVPQLVVLLAIDELGEVTVKQLSHHVSLSQATVTTILNRLERRDFIRRSRNAVDKRVVNCDLTDKGKSIIRETPPLMDDAFMARFEELADSERSRILSSLQTFASLMDGDDVDPRPPTIHSANANDASPD
jgi:DNA-binding MarR family transcriptional regulator